MWPTSCMADDRRDWELSLTTKDLSISRTLNMPPPCPNPRPISCLSAVRRVLFVGLVARLESRLFEYGESKT